MKLAPLVSLLLLVTLTPPLQAQSLGDIAKAEGARRAKVAQPAKVLTNGDLKPVPTTATSEAPTTPTETSPTPALAATAVPGGETHWKGRMQALQTRLEDDTSLHAAAQATLAGLDAYVGPNGRMAPVVADRVFKAQAEVNRLRAVVQNDKNAIVTLEEEARRANVPPGWLRLPPSLKVGFSDR